MDFPGVRVVSSPYAPKGTIYVIDEAAIRDLFTARTPIFEPQPVAVSDSMYFRAGMEIAWRGPTEIERDPMEIYGLPRSFRQWWRLSKKIFGYEFRKANGSLRRHSRRRHGLVTGIVA